MVSDTEADELLQALQKEALKTYRIYDGSDRLITTYETFTNTVNGGPAIKTQYTYVGATTRVEKMKETIDVWSSAYDI